MDSKNAPVGTKCPINPEKTLSPKGEEAKFSVPNGNKKAITVYCSECKKPHYQSDFKKKDDAIQKVFEYNKEVKKHNRIKDKLDPGPISFNAKECESIITSDDDIINLSILADLVRKAIGAYFDGLDNRIKNNTNIVKSIKFTEADRDRVFKRHYGSEASEGKCILCPTIIKNNNYEISHIHPKAYGGGNEYDNLIPLCSKCNRDMGSKHYYSYLWRKYGILHEKWDMIKL
jgi:hypothetical protein